MVTNRFFTCLWLAIQIALFSSAKASALRKESQGQLSQNSYGIMKVQQESFGRTPDGQEVTLYTLTNANRLRARIIDYGTILVSLEVPDRDGKLIDITLGFDDLDSYIKRNPLFGAIVGRYANRIGNAKFTLDGAEYKLTANAGKNHIHGGGKKRFDKVVWKGRQFQNNKGVGVRFTYLSKDGDEGFPGNLNCTVTYTLTLLSRYKSNNNNWL